jgi:hypothetical protein
VKPRLNPAAALQPRPRRCAAIRAREAGDDARLAVDGRSSFSTGPLKQSSASRSRAPGRVVQRAAGVFQLAAHAHRLGSPVWK